MSDVLSLEIEDGVARVLMDRPEAMNALDAALADALVEALEAVEADAAARCVVLGSTSAHFMAGGDLRAFAEVLDRPAEERRRFFAGFIRRAHPAVTALRRMPKPVVASLRGAVAGFGMSLALAADLAVAAEDCNFALAYAAIGASPDGGSTHALPRLVGTRKAMEMAMLGGRLDAAEALRLGLVNRVVAADALDAETAALAARLAAGPTGAFARAKALLNAAHDTPLERQLEGELRAFAECAATGDLPEGVRAFLAKRAPEFAGG